MRVLPAVLGLWICATSVQANPDVDRLVDAMGAPALIRAFVVEGIASSAALDTEFLNGQGGDVWAETVQKLYDPARLENELRDGLAETLDPDLARTALIFFGSELGERIVSLEVQAREAMLDPDLAEMAKTAGTKAGEDVRNFLEIRDLVDRNTDTAIAAQQAFFEGYVAAASSPMTIPDVEAMRDGITAETKNWLLGYYALVQSPLSHDDIQTYSDFWQTRVGVAIDDAVFEVFRDSYTDLSYALGQAIGLLSPASEL